MPQIGPLEILVIGVVALLVFGPEKLPEMARSIGKSINQMKKLAADTKSEFDMTIKDDGESSPVKQASTSSVTNESPTETAPASVERSPKTAASR